jgi:hypothetical protein
LIRWLGLSLLLVAGCSSKPDRSPTPSPSPVVQSALPASQPGVTKIVTSVTGKAPSPWRSQPELGEAKPVSGLSVALPAQRFPQVVLDLQKQLPPGQIAFRAQQNFGIEAKLDTLAIVSAQDPWTVLRFQETNGANYNITTEQIITWLQKWEKELGLTLVGAGMDWAEFHIARLPADQAGFAQEYYKFCPDAVEQGVGSVAALQKQVAEKRLIYLWWD